MEGKNGRRRGPARLSARGMVLLLLIAVVVALACGPAADGAQAAVKRCKGAAKPLKVAVYVGGGTNSDKVCATMRALQACGFDFAGVQRDDIVQGRLVRDSYDVLLLPAGQDDSKVVYDVYWGLGGDPIARDNIRSFVSGGGGVVGLESGAAYMCQDGALQLYSGLYTRTGEAGKTWLGVTDPAFGYALQQVYRTAGGGHFSVPAGCRTVARSLQGRTVIARSAYGSGRVVVCSVDPELRGDSTLDWCIWDNWEMRGCHVNSAGAWALLGRMVNYAGSGVASRPQLKRLSNPCGKRIAVVSTYVDDGGAWSGSVPSVSRAIEHSGNVPLAIRLSDIVAGKLDLRNFKAVVFPGGYCYGYYTQLGEAGGEAVKAFARAGGGVMGQCAGSYYLSRTIDYYGENYYYLDLFKGTAVGEVWDIAYYPHWALTPIATSDPVIGDFGTIQMPYGGGPYFTDLAASDATAVSTYAYSGWFSGTPATIRFTYGKGHVILMGVHPEVRCGSTEDWSATDDYYEGTNIPWVNPDNGWPYFAATVNKWLVK